MPAKTKQKKLDKSVVNPPPLTNKPQPDFKEGNNRSNVKSPPKTERPPTPKAEPSPNVEEAPEGIIGLDPLLGGMPEELAALDSTDDEEETKYPILSKVGKILPIGFVDHSGVKHRDFELIKWDWEMEERLGSLCENEPDMPMNQYVSEVIGHGISRIGSLEVTKMTRGQRRLLIRSMYISDVLYLYIWIRICALGVYLKLDKFKCPSCRKVISDFAADLRTIEVKSYNEIPENTINLEKGIVFANKIFKKVVVGPVRWSFMEGDDISVLTNSAKFKMATLKEGIIRIVGAPEGPVNLTKNHLMKMDLREINKLVTEIDQCGGGPVMEISSKCQYCNHVFKQDVDWRYDNFFDPSSH